MRPGPCGAPACQLGIENTVEKPPPVPSPFVSPGLLFHTVSVVAVFVVPPHPMTCGHDAGRSTLALVGPPSLESLSPDAANTTIPARVASAAATSMSAPASLFSAFQFASSVPHEIEHTPHP